MSETTTTVEPVYLDRPTVDRLLDEILEEVGRDHKLGRDQSCRYFEPTGENVLLDYQTVDNNQPVCIIGKLFYKLGVTMERLIALYERKPHLGPEHIPANQVCHAVNTNRIGWMIRDGMAETDTMETQRFLGAVQQYQDTGRTWGDAVDTARREYPA